VTLLDRLAHLRQSMSSFVCNGLLISPDLIEDGLLKAGDCTPPSGGRDGNRGRCAPSATRPLSTWLTPASYRPATCQPIKSLHHVLKYFLIPSDAALSYFPARALRSNTSEISGRESVSFLDLLFVIALITVAVMTEAAQTPIVKPAFEVGSIKEPIGGTHGGLEPGPIQGPIHVHECNGKDASALCV
jgi:hypothetical protein